MQNTRAVFRERTLFPSDFDPRDFFWRATSHKTTPVRGSIVVGPPSGLSLLGSPARSKLAGRQEDPNETRRPPPGRLPEGARGPWPLVGACAICASLFWGATLHRYRYIPKLSFMVQTETPKSKTPS